MAIWKRKNYLSDYVSTLSPNGKKHLVYQGDFYQCAAEGRTWVIYRVGMLAVTVAELLLWGLASLADPSSLRLGGPVYVLIPYVLLCLPALLALGRSIRLQFLRRQMDRMDYELCIRSLYRCSLAISALGVLAGAAQVLYILLCQAPAPGEWIAALCCFVISAISFLSYRLQRRYPCENIGKAGPRA